MEVFIVKKLIFLSFLLIPAILITGCPKDEKVAEVTVGTKMIAVGEVDRSTTEEPIMLTTNDMKTWAKLVPESVAGTTNPDWTAKAGNLNLVKKCTATTLNRYFVASTKQATDDVTTIWYSDTPTTTTAWNLATINFLMGYSDTSISATTITAVDAVNKTFTVATDMTANFFPGRFITVANSTENDGSFTVVSSVLSGTDTVITVSETVTADPSGLGDITASSHYDYAYHNDNPVINDIVMVSDTIGFATGGDSLFLYTTDGGVTWNEGNTRVDTGSDGDFDSWTNDFNTGYTLLVKEDATLGYFVFIGTSDGIWMVAIATADIGTTTTIANWVWTDNNTMAGADVNLDTDEIVSLYLHEDAGATYLLAMSDDAYHIVITLPTAIATAPTIGTVTYTDLTGIYSVSNYIMVNANGKNFLYWASYSDYIYRIDVSKLGSTHATTDWEEIDAAANNTLSSGYVYYEEDVRHSFVYKNQVAYLLDDSTSVGNWAYGLGLGSTIGTVANLETEWFVDYDDDPKPNNGVTDTSTLERIEFVGVGQTAGAGDVFDLFSWELLD
jgi:hypothetical protein